MVLSKSQGYPGKIAQAERNTAARHATDVQWNHRMYSDYEKFQPVPSNFTPKDIRHNFPSSAPSHS